jgi:hypothetical protein
LSLQAAVVIWSQILAFTMLLQGMEFLLLTRKKAFVEVWSYNNLQGDLERGLPLPSILIESLFSANTFRLICILQILSAAVSLVYPSLALFVVLAATHLLICIRFRGTFNGGSDMMTFVVLTGVIISLASSEEKIQKLGLIYVAIHTLYSYFKAGLVKIVHADWRKGFAVSSFLQRSLFLDMRTIGQSLSSKPILGLLLSWIVLVFEIGIVCLIFFPGLVIPYFLVALIFHFTNHLSFGLNRFFWIWLCAWVAVIFTVLQIYA